MPDPLEIVQLGNPILRHLSDPVENFDDSQLQGLITGLLTTVIDAHGVGIAAPQVAQPHQLFIMASRPNARYPDAPQMEPTVVINPRILQASEAMQKDWEGCLCIPGIRGKVPRHCEIEVEYFDRLGMKQHRQFNDFLARIFQHEYDHLQGILFLNRLDTLDDLATEKEYQRLQQSRE